MKQHPKTWWFKLAEKVCPERCREVPEPRSPDRVLMRQVALVSRRVYLQQFASSESWGYFHSHPWRGGTLAIGLWGHLLERLYVGAWRIRRHHAPYLRYMGPNHVHQSLEPSPGHTSIFIGLGERTDEKYYWKEQECEVWPKHYTHHIKQFVRRI